ncbi:MAG TPA: dTDP-4-dehydrorhamnose reductase [Chthoniobacterales bacterium]|jgi:dTDP-4-dehydrorhamnose reductase|nr:dTDP-4-dehydrorhamnose reductase [Chthoniobacterales bacterium]
MRIVILGAGGRLGAALMRVYRKKFEVASLNHAELDLAKPDEIHRKIGGLEFDILINAAAYTNVDRCETEKDQAFAINADAPRLLGEVCRDKNAKLIHISTDYVFDGGKRQPYTEEDAANPISVYGESKGAGERFVLQASDRHVVVRVSWVFGPDRPSFIDAMIKRARENEKIEAIGDKWSTPTYTSDIAELLPRVFDVDAGIVHLANGGQCTWQEYAQHALDCCREAGVPLKAKTVRALKLADMTRPHEGSGGQANWVARRPVYSVLSTVKYRALSGIEPRSWRDAVTDYIERSYSKK